MTDDDRYTRITLRIPRELHATLDREADRTSKSLNAEIVARLQSSFDRVGSATSEIEAMAYRSHALALESQGMALQHQLFTLMNELAHVGGVRNERAELLRHQIGLTEAKLKSLDALSRELHKKASVAIAEVGTARVQKGPPGEPLDVKRISRSGSKGD